MNRRQLLKTASLLPLAAATPDFTKPASRKRGLRFAYMGDTHILPETKQLNGVTNAFRQIQNQRDKAAFVLHGGDVIMDALLPDKATVRGQFDAWNRVVKAECSLPLRYAIGNHDIWGPDAAKADGAWGKAWIQDELKMPGRYYSFEQGGWHFVILDSVQAKPTGAWYTTRVDAEQMAWLKADLEKTPATTPVLVLSHVPILTATVFDFAQPIAGVDGRLAVIDGLIVGNAPDLVALFAEHPNVKACLSGHTHLLDQVTYNGVTYFCNGAVSGSWWKSDTHRQTKAGFAMFDLYDDGSIERQYIPYSW
jgi:3',5'-cyclic-AMP phosphodiesterase